ncbi:MAG: Fic family protein [Archangium sp.]|nr:Fic family protein [Archangium sp.]
MYLWERADWPDLTWSAQTLIGPLAHARQRQGHLLGRMAQLGFELQGAARVQAVAEEAVKSSAIEGETLDLDSVRSSVARRLGVKLAGLSHPVDQKTEGVVEMVLDATLNFAKPLTAERLFGWQAALFPGGFSGIHRIAIGELRDDREGPMQVVSGQVGKERVHFEAPPAKRLNAELKRFLKWFAAPNTDGLLHAGLAHLWFVTLHPFDDGNGRVARAVTDLALARDERQAARFYSLSSQIRVERKAYYLELERAQRGPTDVTPWLSWFVSCFTRAIDSAEHVLKDVLARNELATRAARAVLNERQKMMVAKLLAGLDGKLTAKRWAAMTKASVDSAQRDLKGLVELKLLVQNPGGSKNTSYALGTRSKDVSVRGE